MLMVNPFMMTWIICKIALVNIWLSNNIQYLLLINHLWWIHHPGRSLWPSAPAPPLRLGDPPSHGSGGSSGTSGSTTEPKDRRKVSLLGPRRTGWTCGPGARCIQEGPWWYHSPIIQVHSPSENHSSFGATFLDKAWHGGKQNMRNLMEFAGASDHYSSISVVAVCFCRWCYGHFSWWVSPGWVGCLTGVWMNKPLFH